MRGNYDYDRELSSIDTVPAYILYTLTLRGLEEPFSISAVVLCQFLVLVGKRF